MGECSQLTSIISTLFHDEGQRNFKYRGWREITVIIRITTRVSIGDIMISLFEERVVGPKEMKKRYETRFCCVHIHNEFECAGGEMNM